MKLKSNCFRIQDKSGDFFVKNYNRPNVLKKVEMIHQALCEISFPYVQPVMIDWHTGQFRQQWIEGTVANYRNAVHRQQVYRMLKSLHATNEYIDWEAKGFSQLNLKRKWQARLVKFQAYEPIIRPYLQQDYDVIVDWAEEALHDMEPIYSSDLPTLLHGDVAHHNFFVGQKPMIIDFDLAIVGPSCCEEIMFVQRVFPMMRYNWTQLVQELPELNKLSRFSAYLRFPNELLREWCYFAIGDETQQSRLYFYVRNLTMEAKRYRSSLLRQLQINL